MKLTIDVVQKKHHMPEKTLQAHMESAFFFFYYEFIIFCFGFCEQKLNW